MYYVYKYINSKNEILYIGQTIDLDRRFNEHKGRIWDIEKEKILFAKCNTLSDMNIYEMYYINKLNPKYNTALVFNDFPSFELPDLEWKIYDKNHFEIQQQQLKSQFKEDFKNKFNPDNYWKNKIDDLQMQFHNENDFLKKKALLIEIRRCNEKIKKHTC